MNKKHSKWILLFATLAVLVLEPARAISGTLIGWNDLGMHCMDGIDFSVFSILPPYNTVHAHLIIDGTLVTDELLFTVTYEAVADPSGSINATSLNKTNFWEHEDDLFGGELVPDVGLTGSAMPGSGNSPQATEFIDTFNWFVGEGIPITPTDDDFQTNYYPMVRLVARDAAGVEVAASNVVLPVSDEMDCAKCHGSGSGDAARPAAGWSDDPDPNRAMKINILRLHDERQGNNPQLFDAALGLAGYNSAGLEQTALQDGVAILCARCHASNALPGTGVAEVPSLTRSVHAGHADLVDPGNGLDLESSDNRSACYSCHPGSSTLCLRGAMGRAVDTAGALSMQCQSCHGTMSAVGAVTRVGWFDQPTCQSCHTGTADQNNGEIRYSSVFDETTGQVRQAVNQTFATEMNTPLAGKSLYRFSRGHSGLQCSACHGSPHAIYPSIKANDNVQNEQLQGHAGTLIECLACHVNPPTAFAGGPHGMHRIGASWVDAEHGDEQDHQKAVDEGGLSSCRACHGSDYRGTVLSLSHSDQAIATGRYGNKDFWRGFRIGCYNCHNGPTSDDTNANVPPVVTEASAKTGSHRPVTIALASTDADPGDFPELHIVSQPQHGTVGLAGNQATYFPFNGISGTDSFTYAAWDGDTESNLGTVSITVVRRGDFENDGDVDLSDAVVCLRIAAGLSPGIEPAELAADVNSDDRIGIEDVLFVLQEITLRR